MWPFRKKSINLIGESGRFLTPNEFILSTFGTNIISWDNYIPNNQNDLLLIQKYNQLSEVSAPINKFAQSAKNVIPEIRTYKNGKLELVPSHYLTIPIQKFWDEQIDKAVVFRLLLGKLMIGANQYGKVDGQMIVKPQDFYLIPPQYTLIKLDASSNVRNNVITSFEMQMPQTGQFIVIPANEVLYIKSNNPDYSNYNYVYGISPLVSCSKNITSIEAGYGAKVGLYKHGPRVVMTGKTQGEFASANATSDENVVQLQERINSRYGLQENQFQVMITDIPLDVTVIGNSVQQLQINENNKADFQKICGVLDIESIILSDDTGSTFTNKQMAESAFYNGSFRSLVEDLCNNFTQFLNRWDRNIVLVPNYSKISQIMEKERLNNNSILEDAKLGLITRNEYLEATNQAIVKLPEFDEYRIYTINGWLPTAGNPVQTNNY